MDYNVPPWVFREFADTQLQTVQGTPRREAENLSDMFRALSDAQPDFHLRTVIHSPVNIIAGDRRLLRLRGLGLAAETADDIVEAYRQQRPTHETLRSLWAMERRIEDDAGLVVDLAAERLEEMYHDWLNVARQSRNYARTVMIGYQTRALVTTDIDQFAPLPDLFDTESEGEEGDLRELSFEYLPQLDENERSDAWMFGSASS